MRHAISLGISLSVLWILLSWRFDPLLVGLGLFSVLLVMYFAIRMDIADHEGYPLHLHYLALFSYWLWLQDQIVKANLDVTRRILDPKLPISPTVVDLKATQSSVVGRVIYANSITLTPGTVSMGVEGNLIHVHALTKEAVDDLLTGEMDRRVTKLDGEI